MKVVLFFGFGERRKWTRWWRGWWGQFLPQNFWSRTAPVCHSTECSAL